MTREEEIKQAADNFIDKNKNIYFYADTFEEGAEWADEHPRKGLVSIDKACEYWNNIAKQAEGEIGYYILSCLEEFKKVMKGE